MNKVQIGKLLQEFGYVTEEQINVALEVKQVYQKLLGEILVELSFASTREIALALSKQTKKPFVDLDEILPERKALLIFTKSAVKQLNALPLYIKDNVLTVAMADPYDINAVDILSRRSSYKIEVCVADSKSIQKYIEMHYYTLEISIEGEIRKQIEEMRKTGEVQTAPLLIDRILNNAITNRATDVHIAPEEFATHIFFRIDGVLRHFYACPKSVHLAIVSRIKILSKMDIAEQRLPQDGAMSHTFFNETFDIRVSTIPSSTGENIVLRILSKNLSLFNLENLGFEENLIKKIKGQLNRSQGIILVTGPTGSGKTTTLYSSLRMINSLQRRVLTVEDPIEYRFPFIKQTQVNEKAGYNFANAMRAFLRQDPDVILVGEMRDMATAEMAMRAAITGHLVLSTIHTNDSVTAIPRMVDLGIKAYLIAAGVAAITGQRLVRKVCQGCAQDVVITGDELYRMGFSLVSLEKYKIKPETKIQIQRGVGCEKCGKTGYSGRMVISEILVITDEIGDAIVRELTPLSIQGIASKQGMFTMKENGLYKVLKKLTTPEEVLRVIS